jgi:hypothetical protein
MHRYRRLLDAGHFEGAVTLCCHPSGGRMELGYLQDPRQEYRAQDKQGHEHYGEVFEPQDPASPVPDCYLLFLVSVDRLVHAFPRMRSLLCPQLTGWQGLNLKNKHAFH